MPTVSFILTEINPSHSEGSGGGIRSHTVTEQNPTFGTGSGGGRRTFVEAELIPVQAIGAGGGRRVFMPEEIPPILSLPLPGVSTGPATGIGLMEATINGFLEDDGGFLCDCAFEWGLTEDYGNITPVKGKTAGQDFSEVLTALEPDTIYHFRAIASNVFGISRGGDRAFRTSNGMPPAYFQNPLISLLEEET
jgi:hypothetical protein